MPAWLERLGAAVDQEIDRAATGGDRRVAGRLPDALAWAPLPWEELRAALARE
jgi:hypothetical protein